MKIKVVCFDIDGTMYPKWITNWKLVRSLFPSLRFALRYQRFRRYVRNHQEELTVPASRDGFRRRQALWLLGSNAHQSSEQQIERVQKRVEHQFYRQWRQAFSQLRPFRHLREALTTLHEQGVTVAALSDFPIEQKLVALDVADLVDWAACTEDSGYLKPHPSPFLMVCSALSVTCEEVLYVGDSYHKDIEGAAQVGMRTALIDPSSTSEKRRRAKAASCVQADTIFSDYQEFMERIPEMLH